MKLCEPDEIEIAYGGYLAFSLLYVGATQQNREKRGSVTMAILDRIRIVNPIQENNKQRSLHKLKTRENMYAGPINICPSP
jgi:hypothetical protein